MKSVDFASHNLRPIRHEYRVHTGLLQLMAVLAFGGPVAAALAQMPSTPILPPGAADYQDMMVQYEAAQAAARRPGDENLSCDAVRLELEATVNNPALQDYVTSTSEQAQRDMEYAQAAMSGNPPAVPPAPSDIPAADRAQASAQLAAEHARQAENLAAITPLLMRAQRLSELAALKACAWLSDGEYPLLTPEPAASQRK